MRPNDRAIFVDLLLMTILLTVEPFVVQSYELKLDQIQEKIHFFILFYKIKSFSFQLPFLSLVEKNTHDKSSFRRQQDARFAKNSLDNKPKDQSSLNFFKSSQFTPKPDDSSGGAVFSASFPFALMPFYGAGFLLNSTTNTTKAPRRLSPSKPTSISTELAFLVLAVD